jgi:hypothetical protein
MLSICHHHPLSPICSLSVIYYSKHEHSPSLEIGVEHLLYYLYALYVEVLQCGFVLISFGSQLGHINDHWCVTDAARHALHACSVVTFCSISFLLYIFSYLFQEQLYRLVHKGLSTSVRYHVSEVSYNSTTIIFTHFDTSCSLLFSTGIYPIKYVTMYLSLLFSTGYGPRSEPTLTCQHCILHNTPLFLHVQICKTWWWPHEGPKTRHWRYKLGCL